MKSHAASEVSRSRLRLSADWGTKACLMAACYAAAGWVGLQLALPPGYATIVWPASGLALAGLLLFGRNLWPGIFLGSFVINAYIGHAFENGIHAQQVLNALLIAVGAAIQALLTSVLLHWTFGSPLNLWKKSDFLFLTVLCGPLACVISPTVGVGVLTLSGIVPWNAVIQNWLTWWGGDVFGVLLVVPIALLGPWQKGKLLWKDEPFTSLNTTMIIGLMVLLASTLATWNVMSGSTFNHNQTSFEALSADSEQALRNRLMSYSQSLDGAAALFEATNDVNASKWRDYVDVLDLPSTLPGISGLGFIEPLRRSGLPDFLREAHAQEGMETLAIHPDTGNDEIFAILYIEPHAPNVKALGLDIAFEENRRLAAIHARDTGKSTITRRIVLVQDKTSSSGFLMLRPVYRKGLPLGTTEERRAAFDGWVYAPFVGPIFMSELTSNQNRSFRISVYDGDKADPNNLIYASSEAQDGQPPSEYKVTRTFPILEQTWTVTWESLPLYEQSVRSMEPLLILLAGLFLTVSFAILLLSFAQREAYVRQQVALKTHDLKQTMDALRDSERRFGDLAGLSPVGIFRTDEGGFCTYVNQAWLDACGLDAQSALGAGWIMAIHKDDRDRVRSEWMSHVGTYNEYRTEFRFMHTRRKERWINLICAPQLDIYGVVSGFIAVAVDVTDQRKAVDALRESEKRFQSLANSAPVGIYRTNALGVMTYANPALLRMSGLTMRRLLGRSWSIGIHPDDVDRVTRDWSAAVQNRTEYRDEFTWVHPDGPDVRVEVLGAPEFGADQEVSGYIGVTLDITEKKLALKELGERDAQLSLLATNATDAVFRVALDGTCTYASPSTIEVLGAAPSRIVGKTLLDSFHAEDRETAAGAIRRLADGLQEREIVTYRFKHPASDEDRWAEANAGLVRDPVTGEPVEIIASVRDITDRKMLEFDLYESRVRAEAATAAKAAFLANMSHEIRTPMNGVIGFTDLLLTEELTDEQRKSAQMIADSGRAMMCLLNDILDISKIDAGQMHVVQEPVEIGKTLQSCLLLMEPNARAKGIEISLTLDPQVPAWILGDSLRLHQILLNLIGNAVKFTDKGSVTIKAYADRDGMGDQILRVQVLDSGIGIAEDRLDAIFQQFAQADSSTARKYGGTGLGLAISGELARLMTGTLTVDSQLGEGASFTLSVPLTDATPDIQAAPDIAVSVGAKTETRKPQTGSRPRVLIAEDNLTNQMLTMSLAARAGLDAEIAVDGREAVRMTTEAFNTRNPYRMIFMDMQMPNMDGLSATRQLRAQGYSAEELPIVALTANAYAEDIRACLDAGMQAHFSKPVRLGDVEAAVMQWISQHEPVAAPPQDPDEQMERMLKQRYTSRRDETLSVLRQFHAGPSPSSAETVRVMDLLHKLAGTAGYFGDETLGAYAGELEHMLKAARSDREALGEMIEKLAGAAS